MDTATLAYFDYVRAELIRLRAEYVFSASLSNSIFEYLKDIRMKKEGSNSFLLKYVFSYIFPENCRKIPK